jgi:hypothetical protein
MILHGVLLAQAGNAHRDGGVHETPCAAPISALLHQAPKRAELSPVDLAANFGATDPAVSV